MHYALSDAELLEFAEFEGELGYSLSAGLDWGDQVGKFFRQSCGYLDTTKLCDVLTEDLGNIFSDSEIQDLIGSFQREVYHKLELKFKQKYETA